LNRVAAIAVGTVVAMVALLMIAVAADDAGSKISMPMAPPSTVTERQQAGVPTAALPSLPPASVRPRGEPIVFRGSRSLGTPPFTLAEGNYTIRWVATPGATTGCFHGGYLRAVDGSYSEDFGGHGPGDGETLADAVMPGHYYLDAISGCDDWTMTIAPR
jgi:hypothetical protein